MPEPGSKLGTYRLLDRIGEGPHSEVFHAEDEKLGRKVALRVLSVTASRDPEMVQRFRKAAQRLAALNHAGIMPILQIDEAEGLTYCAMPKVETGNLRDFLARDPSRKEILKVICHVAEALAFAHGRSLLHRDLKPENIFVNPQGDPVIGDFGLSRCLRSNPNALPTGVSAADARYASPEEALGQPLDERTDVYSLGVVLYEALAGQTPFEDPDPRNVMNSHVNDPVPALPEANAGLQAIVDRALAKDPAQRFPSAQAFADAIRTGQTASPPARPAAPAQPPAPAEPAVQERPPPRPKPHKSRQPMSQIMAEARRKVATDPHVVAVSQPSERGGQPPPAGSRKGLWALLVLVAVLGLVLGIALR